MYISQHRTRPNTSEGGYRPVVHVRSCSAASKIPIPIRSGLHTVGSYRIRLLLWQCHRYLTQMRHTSQRQLLGEVACDPVFVADIAQRRTLDLANILSVAAARVKVAARWRVRRA